MGPSWLQVGWYWGHLGSKLGGLGSKLGHLDSKLGVKLALKLHVVEIAKKHLKISDFHCFFNVFCKVGESKLAATSSKLEVLEVILVPSW